MLSCHIPKDDNRYAQYHDLMELMQIPEIEFIILGKMGELKVVAKDYIKQFFDSMKHFFCLSRFFVNDLFGSFSIFIGFLVEKLSLISYNYYMSKKKKTLKIYQDEYGKEPFIEK